MELEEKQIQGLKRLLSLLDPDTLTKEDFVKNFKVVIDHIKKIEQGNIKALQTIHNTLNKLFEKYRDETSSGVEMTKKEMKDYISSEIEKITREHGDRIKAMDDKMLEVRDGEDADPEEVMKMVLEKIKIPTIEEIKNDLPVMGEEVRDALELLQGDDRLKMEAILGLKEALDELKNRKVGGGGFSKIAMDAHIVDDETPSGTVNGVNTDFTIKATPLPASSLKVYLNGQRMRTTEDYTLSGRTITFLTAPPTGSILLCDYRN